MAFVLSTVMDAIATELTTDIGATFRVSAYPIPDPTPPQVIVGLPTEFEYDYTFHGVGTTGKVRAVLPIRFVVPRVLDHASRDAVSAILTGAPGIAESLGGNLAGAVDTANVNSVPRFESETIAGVDYLVIVFDLEVIG